MLNHMLLIIIWYFFHNYFWPRPRSSGLRLEALASASRLWPRSTSLVWKGCGSTNHLTHCDQSLGSSQHFYLMHGINLVYRQCRQTPRQKHWKICNGHRT